MSLGLGSAGGHRRKGRNDETASLDVTPTMASQTTTNAGNPSDQKVKKIFERRELHQRKTDWSERKNPPLEGRVQHGAGEDSSSEDERPFELPTLKSTGRENEAALQNFVNDVEETYSKSNTITVPDSFLQFIDFAERECNSRAPLPLRKIVEGRSGVLSSFGIARAFTHHYEKFLEKSNLKNAFDPKDDFQKAGAIYCCLNECFSPYTIGMLIKDCKKDPSMMNILFENKEIVFAIQECLGTNNDVYL